MGSLKPKAWEEGYFAFKEGRDVNECPYVTRLGHAVTDPARYEAWVDGWNDGYADSQDRSY